MSSATGSVKGFLEFDDLCKSRQGYSHNLAQLFDICEHDPKKQKKHKISFSQALDRLKQKIEDCFNDLRLQSERSVTEFVIGKTFVKQKKNGATFNPMKPTTWSLGGGINGRWQDYKIKGYDGLIALVCVERNLIPEKVKEANKNAIEMDQQNYALALEQALIQYFALIKTDKRLKNQSFVVGMASKEDKYKGGIVYIAYKLEPEPTYSDEEALLCCENDLKSDDSEQKPHIKDTDVTTDITPKKRVSSESFEANTKQPKKKPKQEETFSSTSLPDDNKNETPESDKSPQNTVNERSLVKSAEKATVTAIPTEDKPKPQVSKLIMTSDEKILILECFIELDVKSDWEKLTEMVFNRRHGKVSKKTISHYEKLPEEKLKLRIQRYINEAKKGKTNETDSKVMKLVKKIRQ